MIFIYHKKKIGTVGKTSILTRYIKGKFVKIDINDRTINASCFKKDLMIDGVLFNLNIWDTAGEEKYHAMAPIFYRGADGAVVIFDFTKKDTFNRAEKWFKELHEFAEGNPQIILVGNKIDLPNKEVDSDSINELARKYNVNFLEVSALTGVNVNEIFNLLTKDIYENKKKMVEENRKNSINENKERRGTRGSRKINIVANSENKISQKRKGNCC